MHSGLLLTILIAVFAGGIAQRVAGIGFGLLLAPFFIIALGPYPGVVVTNVCGALAAGLVIAQVWRNIDWKMYATLAVPAAAGVLGGTYAASVLPPGPLEIGVGLFMLAALTSSLVLNRADVVLRGESPKVAAGLLAGISNSMAGAGVPAVSAYAVLARWPQASFMATMQPFLATLSLTTIAVHAVIDPGEWPELAWWTWVLLCVLTVAGLRAGNWLAPRVNETAARRVVVVLAYLGAVSALVKGIIDLQ
ncbi:sulfite exporter TauE/SafE family protein [Arthrobacter sp. zg-Y877]|uniref:sulfite exporter TauE/SafE family protein n=1 Tax=Arthrobacter sp. zg-Y877 TaxID=3049074 RepID=UPI0025A428A0|nr:sulfite exporter TauE/SafE family protein [Arthrobacter sp. zg-Y877]MDM7990624.1 sulfite exporter TauE/SafE family protein [Arthrobacter sp. zg-Y877]